MTRSHQALRTGFLCTFLFIVVSLVQAFTPAASARGLCSMEYCDCTHCQCLGMALCCQSVCGECWEDINDPNSPNYLGCDTE